MCPRCEGSFVWTSSSLRSLSDVSVQHRPLLDAIEAGDQDKAARSLAEHSEEAGELIAQVVAANERSATPVVDR